MSFNRKPPPKPPRSMPVRSSIPLTTPVRMSWVPNGMRAPAPAPVVERERDAATPAERAHLGRLKAMRCICCELLDLQQQHITDVHHIREGRQARNHWLTLPLCWDCHQGPAGVHGTKAVLRVLKMTEFDLLACVIERTYGRTAA